MRICVVNSHAMARAFMSLGHEVLLLSPGPGPCVLPDLLDSHAFVPELLLEVEFLGPRTILMGLSRLNCAKLFWSVDTHLNSWWHRAYGRMFDAVLTTQDGWVSRLRTLGLPVVEHVPWFGTKRPFKPWSERSTEVCFVGRVTSERPVRARMIEFLQERHGLVHSEGVAHADMLRSYDDTRLIPNESIFSEVNFRLFEGASCGCLVCNQAAYSNIELVFEPGREVAVFEDVLELDALMRRYRSRPDEAERMGRAAWARVNAEHLPEHRAVQLFDIAKRHAGKAPQGPEVDAFAWESVFRLNEAGMFKSDLAPVFAGMVERRTTPDGFVALLRCLDYSGEKDNVLALLGEVLADSVFADSFEVNFTGSVLAFRHGRQDLAKAFWLRHALAFGRGGLPFPATSFDFWLGWAVQSERHWVPLNSGFFYASGRFVPQSAMECLLEANELDPGNLVVARRMNAILTGEGSGGQDFRLHLLSHLGLHRPQDWRLGLELGLTNLCAMRMDQGLEELALALKTARGGGQEASFHRALAAHDPTGIIAAVQAETMSGSSGA